MGDAAHIARNFWERMNTNDWALAARLFAPDFELLWPQSNERISSSEDFVALNAAYPADGKWSFSVCRLIGDGQQAMTETEISDGKVEAVALTLFEVENAMIRRIVEYWPEAYPPPEWRQRWVSPISQ